MILFLATKNKYKIKQFSYILKDFNFEIKTISDFDFNESVEENAETAKENALIKARFWAKKTNLLTLADDSGLEIDVLNREPGIKARRWGGIFEDGISDEDWLKYLMKRMEGIPFEKRTARYRSAWALILPNGKEYVKEILLEFLISEKPKFPYPVGSPMSAVRFFPEYKKIETELTEEEQWSRLSKEIKDWDILKLLGK
jgi:XTP/dITP diphosphohydrolase